MEVKRTSVLKSSPLAPQWRERFDGVSNTLAFAASNYPSRKNWLFPFIPPLKDFFQRRAARKENRDEWRGHGVNPRRLRSSLGSESIQASYAKSKSKSSSLKIRIGTATRGSRWFTMHGIPFPGHRNSGPSSHDFIAPTPR